MSENECYPICNTEDECYARIAEIDKVIKGITETIDANHEDIDTHYTYIEKIEKEIANGYLSMSVMLFEKSERLNQIIDMVKAKKATE